MTWNLTGDRPIWLQLTEQIQLRIVTGEYRAGDRLPSVRELAAEAAVNPNTMQKALTELERSGLIYAQRTSGRFITQDGERIREMRRQMAQEETRQFLTRMEGLGFSSGETLELVRRQVEDGEGKAEEETDHPARADCRPAGPHRQRKYHPHQDGGGAADPLGGGAAGVRPAAQRRHQGAGLLPAGAHLSQRLDAGGGHP